MKILLTGFEPFGGASANQSWEAVRLLPESIEGFRFHKLQLPVVFGEAAAKVLECAGMICPEAVFLIGEAGGRNAVTPETTALNLMDARIPDNAGAQPAGIRIDPEGPEQLHPDLPVREIVLRMQAEKKNIAVSDSAGTYVCNDTFYRVLRAFRGTGVTVDFIHVPAGTREEPVPPVSAEEASSVLLRFISLSLQA